VGPVRDAGILRAEVIRVGVRNHRYGRGRRKRGAER
jgi:hypothetical protein